MSAENHSGDSFEAWWEKEFAWMKHENYVTAKAFDIEAFKNGHREIWDAAHQAGVLAGRKEALEQVFNKKQIAKHYGYITLEQDELLTWLRDRILGEK